MAQRVFRALASDTEGELVASGYGKTDLAVYRQSTGQWLMVLSGGGTQVMSFGVPGLDVPAPADYETGGKPGYGSTSVNGRTSDTWAVDYDLSTVGQILPGIMG